jgi:RNA polymerase sigma-70 factor (ECF subfamily)
MGIESSECDEAILIERVKQGERAGFDSLVRIYRQRGLNVAYNMVGNLDDAKDVLQEAFIKVYLHIKNFREKSRFSTWFYRIVVNCSLDFLRKRKKIYRMFLDPLEDEDGDAEDLQISDTSFEPSRVAMASELNRNLEVCIAELSEKQNLCFVLRHQNGLSIEEISKVLEMNPATVKVHLFRAIGNLRKRLAGYVESERRL